MFKRHCITINYLNGNSDIEYLLFVDADMGIINPRHRIEDYIDPKYDMLFYERIYDYEIVAGSFLINDWEGVFDYVACARSLLNDRLIFGKIKVLSKKSRSSWARDGWLTNSTWSPKDFILHGWKSIFLDQPGFAMWTTPFVPHVKFRLSQCDSYANPFKDWKYKPDVKRSDKDIEKKLNNISMRVRKEYNIRLKRIWNNPLLS
uniref:Glycosyltransferase n=1 Tax=Panagrolaimus sp. ES5 TaxID=591445 RepID=A0AC34FY05_9BILA